MEEKSLKEIVMDLSRKIETDKKSSPFKWPRKWQMKFRQSKKQQDKTEKVLLLYLNLNGMWEVPKFVPIVSGDIVVIRNKVYRIDPKDITRLGKYNAYVCREIDKELVPGNGRQGIEPISNANYDEVVRNGRGTSNHPTLIKAILAARQEQKEKKEINKKAIIIGLLILGAVVAGMQFLGK